jgi:hypothetical protein
MVTASTGNEDHSSVNGLLASRSGTSSTFSPSNGSGSGVKTVNATRFKAVSETRSWDCKISRVSNDTTVDDVKEYMRDQHVPVVSIEMLNSRQGSSKSMHIEVSYDDKDKVVDGDFWPQIIRVAGWRHVRVRQQQFHHYRNWEFDY